MNFADEIEVGAPQHEVWQFFASPAALARCLPGLDEVGVDSPGLVFAGTASIEIGSSTIAIPARIEWLQQSPRQTGHLRAVAWVADQEVVGEGTIHLLTAGEGATIVRWQGTVTVPEQFRQNTVMAQVARSFALRFLNGFFACVRSQLEVA